MAKRKLSKKQLVDELLTWYNSLHHLHSQKLSSVGIDDMGDLRDEVPEISTWTAEFFEILEK